MTKPIIGATSDPTINDLLNKVKKDVFYSLNCVQIGTIRSYNNVKNTVEVTINFKRMKPDLEETSYPLLVDVPLVILSGGDSCLSFPVSSGDQCVLLFNDRCIDDWWYDGTVGLPMSSRAHSLSDGLALVGIRNLKTATTTPSGSVCLEGGSHKIAIKNTTTDLLTVLNNLVNVIAGITTVGTPTAHTISPTSQQALIGTGSPTAGTAPLSTQLTSLLSTGA